MSEVWLMIHYYCCENGDRQIQYVRTFRSDVAARADMNAEADVFLGSVKAKNILHDRRFDNRRDIDIRGGANQWYTWETVKIITGGNE